MNNGILSNNSRFGRMMTRAGILIASNLLFVLSCIPVVTAGAGLCALYHTLFRTLRGDGEINPFSEFYRGFKNNFKQATVSFVFLTAFIFVLLLEIFWCKQFVGAVALFRYGLYVILMIVLVLALYLYPTMAAFDAPLKMLFAHSFYFAMKRPMTMMSIVLTSVVPSVITIVHRNFLPLYAFIWCFIGVSGIAMLHASMLLHLFEPYLPLVDVCGEIIPENEESFDQINQQTESKVLEDMMKLGM
ncbi:MAG: DUF624 domain-containing protein [Oscillospiraceae bacterium]|nr:DUF624 domain-containing protein [Oscillospiraceae bacterium]